MTDTQIKTASVGVDTSGPATIRSTLQLPGEIRFNEDRTAHVVPRVAGVVESSPVALGQQASKGQVLGRHQQPGHLGSPTAHREAETAKAHRG